MGIAKVNVIYTNDGHGLKKDAEILCATLRGFGCDVKLCVSAGVTARRRNIFQRFFRAILYKFNAIYFLKHFYVLLGVRQRQVIIHLENICLDALLAPGKHVLIPNQEWFQPSTSKLLTYIDVVWCKSILAQQVFAEYSVKTAVVGFTTQVLNNNVRRSNDKVDAFVSRIGNSALRGVDVLVEAWHRHPEWPVLNIVVPPARRILPCPPNVIYVDEFSHPEEYLSFSARFKFQIFATQSEGFGHSIFEAVDAGSVVLVTDGPPMNEWFSEANAIMIDARYKGQHRLSPTFGVTQRGLDGAVERALGLSETDACHYREAGYRQLNELQRNFTATLEVTIKQLLQ